MAQTQVEANAKYRLKHDLERISFDYPTIKKTLIKKTQFTYAEVMNAGMEKLKIEE